MKLERCERCGKEVEFDNWTELVKWSEAAIVTRRRLGERSYGQTVVGAYCENCAERFKELVKEFNNPPGMSKSSV